MDVGWIILSITKADEGLSTNKYFGCDESIDQNTYVQLIAYLDDGTR